jgi:hypothetical protein
MWYQEATRKPNDCMLREWTSWVFYAHIKSKAYRIRPGYYDEVGLITVIKKLNHPSPPDLSGFCDLCINADDDLISFVVGNMQHEGVLFGLPEETDVEGQNGFFTARHDDDEGEEEPSLKLSMASSLVYAFRLATIQLFRDTLQSQGVQYFLDRTRDGRFEMYLQVRQEARGGSYNDECTWNEEIDGSTAADGMDFESAAIYCLIYTFRKEIAKSFTDTIEREGLEYFKDILGKKTSFELSLATEANS